MKRFSLPPISGLPSRAVSRMPSTFQHAISSAAVEIDSTAGSIADKKSVVIGRSFRLPCFPQLQRAEKPLFELVAQKNDGRCFSRTRMLCSRLYSEFKCFLIDLARATQAKASGRCTISCYLARVSCAVQHRGQTLVEIGVSENGSLDICFQPVKNETPAFTVSRFPEKRPLPYVTYIEQVIDGLTKVVPVGLPGADMTTSLCGGLFLLFFNQNGADLQLMLVAQLGYAGSGRRRFVFGRAPLSECMQFAYLVGDRRIQNASYSGCRRAEGIGSRPGPAVDTGSYPATHNSRTEGEMYGLGRGLERKLEPGHGIETRSSTECSGASLRADGIDSRANQAVGRDGERSSRGAQNRESDYSALGAVSQSGALEIAKAGRSVRVHRQRLEKMHQLLRARLVDFDPTFSRQEQLDRLHPDCGDLLQVDESPAALTLDLNHHESFIHSDDFRTGAFLG